MQSKNNKLIALFIPNMGGGGAERITVNLCKGLVALGYPVDIVLAKADGPFLSEIPENVRVVDLNKKKLRSSLPGLIHYLYTERPAVLLSALSDANVIAIIAKILSHITTRLIITVHNTMSIDYSESSSIKTTHILPLLLKVFYRHADCIIAVSNGVADDIARVANLSRSHIKVIYNPVITSNIFDMSTEHINHPWFDQGEIPIILSIGRLTHQKDYTTLIKAFAKLQNYIHARLIILGEGEDRLLLTELINEIGLNDKIDLPGYKSNPYSFISKSSVFALSSCWEGLPTVLIEALACGIPVVSTDCPSGPREILQDGKYGKLVPVGDVNALCNALYESITNPVSIDIAACCERFTLEHALAQYESCLFENK
jgi:glycosyltransferase involved in cell wall biosynthesis